MSAGGAVPGAAGRHSPHHEPPSHAALARQLLEEASRPDPSVQIVEAPRGLGKTTLLATLGARLWQQGRPAIALDCDALCTCPTDFPVLLIDQIRRQMGFAAGWPGPASRSVAQQIEELLASDKPELARVLDLALALPGAIGDDTRRDLFLLVDDLAEIGRFFRHAGLRGSLEGVAARLAAPGGARLIATVSPASRPAAIVSALRAASGDRLVLRRLEPLSEEETLDLFTRAGAVEPAGWFLATVGRPGYIEILLEPARGQDPAAALREGLRPPHGALHLECRYDYHLLIERSRGDAAVRGILDLLAQEEGANVTAIARHLRIALPTALDYLSWLLEVGLIVRAGSGYLYADPLLKLWVRLNGPRPADLAQEVDQFLRRPLEPPPPPARRRGRRPRATQTEDWDGGSAGSPPTAPPRAPEPERRDTLIEID